MNSEPLWLKVLTGVVIAIVLILAAILWASDSRAAALEQAHDEIMGVTIILYDEPCMLAAVVNLPLRAQWLERGKTFEGCYARHPAKIIMAYFEDRTVVIFPASAFGRVQSA